MKKAMIIFSGYNQRAVIAFLRTLEKNNIDYGIIASSPRDAIYLTDYKNKVTSVRQKKELDMDELLGCIKETQDTLKAQSYVIAPSTEALNRFLVVKREVFGTKNCEVPLVNKTLYEAISDKKAFGDLCKKYAIMIPEQYTKESSIVYPFVIKPKTYVTKTGETHVPIIVKNKVEFEHFKQEHNPSDFFYQQYIEGTSNYLLYYFYKNKVVTRFSQKNLVQQAEGRSIIAAVSTDFHNDEESQKYERLFLNENFFGLVMVEVRSRAGQNIMIEANPRFWGPSQLFIDAGVNLFEAFLADNDFLSVPRPESSSSKETKYFWHGGMVDSLKQSGRLDYYGYTKEQLDKEFKDWLAADIYRRDDTIDLYKEEVE